jgi:hypothetical protein
MHRVRVRERSSLANNNNVTCTVAKERSKQTRYAIGESYQMCRKKRARPNFYRRLLRRKAAVSVGYFWWKLKHLTCKQETAEQMLRPVLPQSCEGKDVRETVSHHYTSAKGRFIVGSIRALVAPCEPVVKPGVAHPVHHVSLVSCGCCASFVLSSPRRLFEIDWQP